MEDESRLTAAETAELLGISKASLRNWEKHELLKTTEDGSGYSETEVQNLLEQIRSGRINRLNSRANKKQKKGTITPSSDYTALCQRLSELTAPVPVTMFLISLRLFIINKLAADKAAEQLLQFKPADYKTPVIIEHLKTRYLSLKKSSLIDSKEFGYTAEIIMQLELPRCLPADTDIAGIIYQAVSRSGDRAASGSFYTPKALADQIAASAVDHLRTPQALRCIDPCCGTGQFLLSFIKAGGSPGNVFGIDSDATAAFTAASNIFLQYPDIDFQPHIFTADSLLDDDLADIIRPESFDMIITNPPWGACTAGKIKKLSQRYPDIRSGETFSYFINRAFELTRNGGLISVVLPESVTNVKRHQDIRDFILSKGRVGRIENHGRIFKGVYTPVVTMELIKTEFKLQPQDSISAFNINISSTDNLIIDKIYSNPHTNLKGKADWALGIVTGDNKKYIRKFPDTHPDGWEPVIRGSDIMPGLIKQPEQYTIFEAERFQQSAPEWKYRTPEKLVYRFISKRLVFALDTEGRLTLNSANIILPGSELTEKGFTAYRIMQLFNSDLYSFIYRKRFNSIKILRSHLEELPLIKPESGFGLTPAEIQYINNQQ